MAGTAQMLVVRPELLQTIDCRNRQQTMCEVGLVGLLVVLEPEFEGACEWCCLLHIIK
jgi:hypothetical protein